MTTPHVSVCYRLGQFVLPPRYARHPSTRLASTPGDNLAEFAGRLCYDSVTSVQGRPTPDYHAHIHETGHNCYDEETEVLTASGWKRWPDVDMDDDLATIAGDGHIVYQRPEQLVAYDYHGRMYRVTSQHVDLLVTPNHRMYVCPMTTREGRRKVTFDCIPAEKLGQIHHAYRKDGVWDGHTSVPTAVAMLLGFTIGDGHVPAGDRRIVSFHLRRPRKVAWLTAAAAAAGWTLRVAKDKYHLTVAEEFRQLFQQTYDTQRERQIPPDVLTTWDRASLDALYVGLEHSDGSIGKTDVQYSTVSERLAGQVQQLLLHIGLAGNVRKSWHATPFGSNWLYVVGVIRRSLRPDVNRNRGTSIGTSRWIEDWSGRVYCAAVPNGTLYVRRNGVAVWCGNSVYAHAVETFTVRLPDVREAGADRAPFDYLASLVGRPGVWVTSADHVGIDFAASLRAVIEWPAHGVGGPKADGLGVTLRKLLEGDFPLTLRGAKPLGPAEPDPRVRRAEPCLPQEKWVSLYMEGLSRDCLHELIRHHYQANPSVRSTRYCDEGDSHQVLHPALAADPELGELVAGHNDAARTLYRHVFRKLAAAGVDKKTARGAARSVLPGATETRLVYSLSVAQAKHILALRADQSTGSADPEIVRLAGLMREVLRAEGWAV